jgi:hypothetical protein
LSVFATARPSLPSLPSLEEIAAERARRMARHSARAAARARLRRYREDPVAFVTECLLWPEGARPTAYQAEILEALARHHRIAVRGPHGIGKTTLAAWAVLWFAVTRDAEEAGWKVATTASAWRQLTAYLWPEIHQWARRLDWSRVGQEPFESLALSLRGRAGEAFALASDQPALLEGAHAQSLLYVLDEAKAIPTGTWDAIEGAFAGAGRDTTAEAFALAISTPGAPSGRFYEVHRRAPGYEDWWTRHVTLEEAIAAGRVSREWAAQRQRQWGERSTVYQNRVRGEFAAQDEASVIPLAWVELAQERWRAWQETTAAAPTGPRLTTVGVDVGLTGDRSVLALRVGPVVTELRRLPRQPDPMPLTGAVAGLLRERGGRAVVDVIGIGAGVVGRLRELGLPVLAFHAAQGTEARDRSGECRFMNLRSAAWWALRERLDPSSGEAIALPPDDLLTGDLTAPTWSLTSSGRIAVEPKETLSRRLGRSTDDGDAVIMAFADGLLGATHLGRPLTVERPSYYRG